MDIILYAVLVCVMYLYSEIHIPQLTAQLLLPIQMHRTKWTPYTVRMYVHILSDCLTLALICLSTQNRRTNKLNYYKYVE